VENLSAESSPHPPYLRSRHCNGECHSPDTQTKGAHANHSSHNVRASPSGDCARIGGGGSRLRCSSLRHCPSTPRTGSDPWDNAVNVLKTAFTGTIATGLSLVAIVVGGLMFAYGEGQSKKTLAGIVFGVGMAIGAVNFMAWLFPS
jgi:type IV secretory pathway VirB2 component (pilin)